MSIAKAMADQYFVIIPDAVNHGVARHQQAVDYAIMAADIVKLMQEMAISSAAVLGHSMGGKTAMQLTQQNPELVKCLVVADIAPIDYPPGHQAVFEAMLAVRQQLAEIKSRRDADRIMANHIAEAAVRQFLLKNLQRDKQGGWHWRLGLDEIIGSYPAIAAAPSMERSYTGPALFIRGERSGYIQDRAISVIHTFFPTAEIKTIEGAGHWLHAEQPEVFNQAVKTFLELNYVQD